MGNFLPCLAHGGNGPTHCSITKQKFHCYTIILNRLYKFKQSKVDATLSSDKEDDSTIASLSSRYQQREVSQDQKGKIRVKVVLTKKEATQLLSMSLKRDKKTIGQIMTELTKMEADRLEKEDLSGSRNGIWRPVLESIAEESAPIA